jgi:fumarate reductase subunit D
MTGSLLYLQRHPERISQTLTALAGTGFLLGLFALAPTWWWTVARAAGEDVSIPTLLLLSLIVWSLLVMAHILRHALSAPLPIGLVAAVAFYGLAVSLQDALFPMGE